MLERGHESVRRAGLSSDIQDAIGQRLRAEYALERSMPARLANLLKEFEQRNDKAKHLPETVMRARLECKRSSDPTFNHSVR